MPKPITATSKSAGAENVNLPPTYADTLLALDQVEVDLKCIATDLDRHATQATDQRDIAALHRARALCLHFVHSFDGIRRRRADVDCGETLLPKALKG